MPSQQPGPEGNVVIEFTQRKIPQPYLKAGTWPAEMQIMDIRNSYLLGIKTKQQNAGSQNIMRFGVHTPLCI